MKDRRLGPDVVIAMDDPASADVGELLEHHQAFTAAATPAEFRFGLDAKGLADPSVTFYSARRDGQVLGVGALKHLDDGHAEVKSMHTSAAARGQGIGLRMVEHLLGVARQRGYRRVSLETGTAEAFAPARALYAKAGFTPCEPFGDYVFSDHNTWMTIVVD